MSRINGSPDMELKASGFDVETPSGRKTEGSSRPGRATDARSNPRSRRVNRSARGDAFDAFADEVLRDLDPRGPLESVIAEHVVLSAWRLKRATDRRAARLPAKGEEPDRPDEKARRASVSASDLAARSVKEGLESLDHARNGRRSRETPPPAEASAGPIDTEIAPNEWPIVPFHPADGPPIEGPAVGDDVPPIWNGRLVFDFEVSDVSPVVKGTWITVSHVVSLIVDGYSWVDILRSHPELSEKDVRVCVAYAVAQDRDQG